MNYLTRQLICERLRFGNRQSYRIVATSYGPLISSDDVLHIINQARRGIREPLDYIPSDMATADEIAGDPRLNGIIPAARILMWTHRRHKNMPPHFRFNMQTTRFSRSMFFDWLDARSRIRGLA